LLQHIEGKESIRYEENDFAVFISYNCFKFWIPKEKNKLIQIGAYTGFKGKYNGIGIGSTLREVKEKYGSWTEDLYVYGIPQVEGLCFELADNGMDEEWILEQAPIEAIYVNDPDEFHKEGDPVFDASLG